MLAAGGRGSGRGRECGPPGIWRARQTARLRPAPEGVKRRMGAVEPLGRWYQSTVAPETRTTSAHFVISERI
jgi:hypothetical protein